MVVTATVYTDANDQYGLKIQEWLKDHKCTVVVKDVSDEAIWEEMAKMSGQYAIPVTHFGTDIIIGYNPEGLAKALAQQPE